MLALLWMTGVDSRFFTVSGHPAWPMYFTAWKRFAPLAGKSAEIAFFYHELFFWQNIKPYGGSNPRCLHAPDADGPDAVESGENANEGLLPCSLKREKA